ncbi:MAG: glycosyltransferase family 2 protein [Candidatus Nanohaloarchaea archaeon]
MRFMESFSVIIPVYRDREQAVETVSRLERAEPPGLEEVVLVVDGDSLELDWERATVIENPERQGKARAVNQALQQIDNPVAVLASADVSTEPETFSRLARKVSEEGGVAAPMVRSREGDSRSAKLADVIWRLHHYVSRRFPKVGEMVAFRSERVLPEDSVADEEYLSSAAETRHYLPDTEVVNSPPASLKQLYVQRRRIFAGHLQLQRSTGHTAPTNEPLNLVLAVRDYLLEGGSVFDLGRAGLLEFFARLEGLVWAVLGKEKSKWKRVKTVEDGN